MARVDDGRVRDYIPDAMISELNDRSREIFRLIVDASQHSQLWVTTHSQALATCIADASGEPPIELELVDGETQIVREED